MADSAVEFLIEREPVTWVAPSGFPASLRPDGLFVQVEVVAGGVYLHNRSGVRKATGSYFTKPCAVEHLLDHALAPALDDHVARLDALRAAADDAALTADASSPCWRGT